MAKRRSKRKSSQVTFYTYPKLVFVWPLIAIGFILYPLSNYISSDYLQALGWIYLATTLLVTLTISVDIERNHAAFWAVVFLAIFFLGMWLKNFQNFTLFGDIYRFFSSLNLQYSPGFGLALSILLSPPYLLMLIWSRLQHKWRITHNEFEHISFGRADDSLARGAKRVRSTYPDLLELFTLGAGTLIVYSATGSTELRRIPHVPMLFLIRKKIDCLLESTAVTDYMHNAELLEAEEFEDESPSSTHSNNKL